MASRPIRVRESDFVAVWGEGDVYADIYMDGVRAPVDVLNSEGGDGSRVWTGRSGLRLELRGWVADYGDTYRQERKYLQ